MLEGELPGRRPLVVGTLALVALLAGCATSQEGLGNPFRADFDQAMAKASDYQRSILEDYEITDAEYADARDEFKRCLEDAGFDVTLHEQGTRMEGIEEGQEEAADAALVRCMDESLVEVEPLYLEVLENPQNEDRMVLMTDCLKRSGLLAEDVSTNDYATDPDIVSHTDPRYTECGIDPKDAFRE
jgi:hypothetical protein